MWDKLILGWHRFAARFAKNPNGRWAQTDTFYLWQAAYLWVDMEPVLDIPLRGLPAVGFKNLVQALIDGDISAMSTFDKREVIVAALMARRERSVGLNVSRAIRLTRDELKKLALRYGEEPKFLFPEGGSVRIKLRPGPANPKSINAYSDEDIEKEFNFRIERRKRREQ